MKNLHHPTKKNFQVERVSVFSDAVFAIAITLLVIDIKVPDLKGLPPREHNFLQKLFELSPKFIGFVISFFNIGLYWAIRHRMFGFVINCSRKLIWLNLLFLFPIVLMPFTTVVESEYSTLEYINHVSSYSIYVLNVCLTGFPNFLLWKYIGNLRNGVAEGFPGGDFLQKAKIRPLIVPMVFILSLLVAISINLVIGSFVLFFIPVFLSMIRSKSLKN